MNFISAVYPVLYWFHDDSTAVTLCTMPVIPYVSCNAGATVS